MLQEALLYGARQSPPLPRRWRLFDQTMSDALQAIECATGVTRRRGHIARAETFHRNDVGILLVRQRIRAKPHSAKFISRCNLLGSTFSKGWQAGFDVALP